MCDYLVCLLLIFVTSFLIVDHRCIIHALASCAPRTPFCFSNCGLSTLHQKFQLGMVFTIPVKKSGVPNALIFLKKFQLETVLTVPKSLEHHF